MSEAPSSSTVEHFVDRWKFSSASERGSAQSFICELCKEVLGVEWPSRKRGTARQGPQGWQRAMKCVEEKALRYARALPLEEGWPPFLVVIDIGHGIDLYADFARHGKAYTAYPDQGSFRITIDQLTDEATRERLRKVFEAPLELDPARQSARPPVRRASADPLHRR